MRLPAARGAEAALAALGVGEGVGLLIDGGQEWGHDHLGNALARLDGLRLLGMVM